MEETIRNRRIEFTIEVLIQGALLLPMKLSIFIPTCLATSVLLMYVKLLLIFDSCGTTVYLTI